LCILTLSNVYQVVSVGFFIMLIVNTLFVNQPIRYFNWPRKKI